MQAHTRLVIISFPPAGHEAEPPKPLFAQIITYTHR
jgi:hypothetical protein